MEKGRDVRTDTHKTAQEGPVVLEKTGVEDTGNDQVGQAVHTATLLHVDTEERGERMVVEDCLDPCSYLIHDQVRVDPVLQYLYAQL